MDRLDLLLAQTDIKDLSQFKDNLLFNMEFCIMDEMMQSKVMDLISSDDIEQMVKAKEIIDQNTPKPPHKQFNEFIKTHGL